MSSNRRFLSGILAIAMISISIISVLPFLEVSAAGNIVITLDPGHGGDDPGATGATAFGGMNEKDYNLIFCQYIEERLLQYGEFTVYITRRDDTFISLSERPAIAKRNNSDAFVSVHCNSSSAASGNGAEIYTYSAGSSNYTASQAAAKAVLSKMVAASGTTNRGVKTDTFTVLSGANSKGISVGMLVEVGFVTNQGDYNKVFATDAARKAAGYAIADGLAAYYGKTLSSVVAVSNDGLFLKNADGNIHKDIGSYAAWDQKLSLRAGGPVHLIDDFGWVALRNATSYQFGYIINGQKEIFRNEFTADVEEELISHVLTNYGSSATPARFSGKLPISELSVGQNIVQLCVRVNGNQTIPIRAYTVELRGLSVYNVSNDELRYLDADGNKIGQAFTPAAYNGWDKQATIDKNEVKLLVDWGWVAVDADEFEFGYIINGTEYFGEDYKYTTESQVLSAINAYGANSIGSRFMGELDTELLREGSNNVQFCVKLNGTVVEILRAYTVNVIADDSDEESTTEEPTTEEPTTEEPTTEESTTEESTTEEPTTEESTTEEPTTEEPTTEESTTEEPTTEEPTTEESTTEESTTEESTTEESTTEEPTTEEPTTEEPTTEEPTTEEPTTEEPTIEEPTTEEPTFEESTTEFNDSSLNEQNRPRRKPYFVVIPLAVSALITAGVISALFVFGKKKF